MKRNHLLVIIIVALSAALPVLAADIVVNRFLVRTNQNQNLSGISNGEAVFQGGVTIGGVRRTDWPTGGGSGGGVQTGDLYSVLTGYPFLLADQYSGTVAAVDGGLLTLSGDGVTVGLETGAVVGVVTGATAGLYYPLTSNPSNWVTASVTNGLLAASITNGATTGGAFTNGLLMGEVPTGGSGTFTNLRWNKISYPIEALVYPDSETTHSRGSILMWESGGTNFVGVSTRWFPQPPWTLSNSFMDAPSQGDARLDATTGDGSVIACNVWNPEHTETVLWEFHRASGEVYSNYVLVAGAGWYEFQAALATNTYPDIGPPPDYSSDGFPAWTPGLWYRNRIYTVTNAAGSGVYWDGWSGIIGIGTNTSGISGGAAFTNIVSLCSTVLAAQVASIHVGVGGHTNASRIEYELVCRGTNTGGAAVNATLILAGDRGANYDRVSLHGQAGAAASFTQADQTSMIVGFCATNRWSTGTGIIIPTPAGANAVLDRSLWEAGTATWSQQRNAYDWQGGAVTSLTFSSSVLFTNGTKLNVRAVY